MDELVLSECGSRDSPQWDRVKQQIKTELLAVHCEMHLLLEKHKAENVTISIRAFWTFKFRELRKRMTVIRKHCLKSLLIPYNSACHERGFSVQNNILGKRRLRMKTKLLRDLMFIQMNGPKWNNEDSVLKLLISSIRR